VILTGCIGGQTGAGPTFPMLFSSDGEYLLTGPNPLPGRPMDVRIVDGVVEFTGFESGECTACPPGPPYTRWFRFDGTELVPTDAPAAPGGSIGGGDLAEIRRVVQQYLDTVDFGCPTEISDRTLFISDVDPAWAHTGWYDPRPTAQCQGGTIAVRKTASGWVVSEGFDKCPAAVDREFRDRVGPNAGC
jgi:hypothetical protein